MKPNITFDHIFKGLLLLLLFLIYRELHAGITTIPLRADPAAQESVDHVMGITPPCGNSAANPCYMHIVQ